MEPVAGALGATVTGLDLTTVTEAAQLDALRQALAEHLVVFLPEQDLSLDDLERVTELLGGRDVTPFGDPLEDRPFVIRVVKEPTDLLNFANAWHSDLATRRPRRPTRSSTPGTSPLTGATRCGRTSTWPTRRCRPVCGATLDGLGAVHSAGMAYGTGGLLDQVKDLTSMAIAPSAEAYAEHVHPAVVGSIRSPAGGRSTSNPVYTTRFPRLDQGGVTPAADTAAPTQHQRELHLPPALVGAHARHLVQPVHHAPR